MKKTFDGINIQWPISQEIITGKKTIETRTYKLPEHYRNVLMLLIETPGKEEKFKSRAIGLIRFTDCFLYQNKIEFYADQSRHLVTKNSPWAWKEKRKWGWKVEVVERFKLPQEIKQHGIVYRKNIEILV